MEIGSDRRRLPRLQLVPGNETMADTSHVHPARADEGLKQPLALQNRPIPMFAANVSLTSSSVTNFWIGDLISWSFPSGSRRKRHFPEKLFPRLGRAPKRGNETGDGCFDTWIPVNNVLETQHPPVET